MEAVTTDRKTLVFPCTLRDLENFSRARGEHLGFDTVVEVCDGGIRIGETR